MSKEKQIEEMANEINEMDEPNAHYYGRNLKEHNKYFDEVKYLKGEKAIAERREKDARTLFKDAVIQLQNARREVAREIFEEIEKLKGSKYDWTDCVEWDAIAELKEKYTREK